MDGGLELDETDAVGGVMFDDASGDEEVDQAPAASHDRLLQNINRLDSKRAGRSIVQRSEAAPEISEFHMAAAEDAGVNVHDLLTSLGDQARHAGLRREVNRAKHQRKLPAPLEKPQALKVQRKAGYEKTTKEVTRWENVVKQRRGAEHLSFPLEKPDIGLETSAERTAAFVPQTPLEQEIAALLGGSTAVVPAGQILSEAERQALAAMSLDEALERRKQLAKHRALLTYQEAKHRRQNKIKSRKYRRVLKKERLKQHLKEFEQLKICDPEAALAKLREMEKQRVEERMSQRHKNTGKWARLQAIKRKYDPAAREALAENLRIGREKTQKTAQSAEDGSSDEEEEEGEEGPAPSAAVAPTDPSNPWMAADSAADSVADTYGRYDKFWTEQEAAKRRLREAERQEEDAQEDREESEDEDRPAPRVTAADIAAEPDSEADPEPLESEEPPRPAGKKGKALKRKADAQTEGKKKTKKLKKGAKKAQDIDGIFDSYEKVITKKTKKAAKLSKDGDEPSAKKQKKQKKKVAKKAKKSGSDDDEPPSGDEAEKMDVSAERRTTMDELEGLVGDKAAPQPSAEELVAETEAEPVPGPGPGPGPGAPARSAPELDPAKFMAVETRRLRSLRPGGDDAGGDDALDDADDARMTMAEAFADDDVVAEFREEKESTIDADKPKDIDLALPGWGDWGGKNIQMSAKKRRRLLFKAPKGPQRKDHHIGHVILSEKRNEALRAHQPSELPHYVSGSVAAFEASIRAPIGRTWLPARAHEQLTQPAVSIRAGTVIKPMDESALLAGRRARGSSGGGRMGARRRPK